MGNQKTLVFGTVAYDCIETPYDKADYILGGSASFASLAASFFCPVELVSVVGNDFRDTDIKRLTSRNINISGVDIVSDKKSFFWKGKYHDNFKSRDTLEVSLNAFEDYYPKVPEEFKCTKYVLLGNISPTHQMNVLNQIGDGHFVVIDTMNLWIEIENESLRSIIGKADIFILNDEEAELLTGENNMIVCGEILMGMGAKSVIIKKGANGAMLFHEEGMFIIPSYPVRNLHDPTGAGDSFAGALTGYLASCDGTKFSDIKKGMLYGSAVASLTVESFSCDKLEVAGMKEIDNRLNRLLEISTL